MRRLGDRSHEDVDLSTPVLRADMARDDLVLLLDRAMQARFPSDGTPGSPGRQAQRRQYRRAINLFAEFLAPRKTVNLMEATLDEFMGFLVARNGGGSPEHWAEYKSNIRCLVNDLPEGVRRRPLLSPQQARWTDKLSNLSPESQGLLREFQRDGRKSRMTATGTVVLRTQRLTDATRDGCVSSARTMLKAMGMDDLRGLTPAAVREFLAACDARGARDAGLRHIGNIRPLCRFLLSRGIIGEDPLAGIADKPASRNMDYVRADGIAKLADLRTVDMDDAMDVRDRMIAFAMCYDLALRRGEASWLDVPEMKLRNSDHGLVVHLHLPTEKQKGQNKRDCDIFSLFPQSARLVARYLQLRQRLGPKDDAFLVSERGERLLCVGVADAVRDQCDRLGIRTKSGKPVSPHRLRHSLATLNAMPLGKLDESDLAKRLRHESTQTTRKIYVDNNPEVDWQRHQKLLDRMNASGDANEDSTTSLCSASDTSVVSEIQAISMLAELGITPAGLHAAADKDQVLMGSSGGVLYPRAYVEDIRDNWTAKQEAMLMLGMTDHQLWHWLNLSGKKARLIGKVSLVRKAEVWDELRKRAARKTA